MLHDKTNLTTFVIAAKPLQCLIIYISNKLGLQSLKNSNVEAVGEIQEKHYVFG